MLVLVSSIMLGKSSYEGDKGRSIVYRICNHGVSVLNGTSVLEQAEECSQK